MRGSSGIGGWIAIVGTACGPSSPVELGDSATDSPGQTMENSAGTTSGGGSGSGVESATATAGTSSGESETCVAGQVVISEGQAVPSTLDGGLAIVRLEEFEAADGSSVELGRFELSTTAATGLPITFEVCGFASDPLSEYIVTAHLDLDLNGEESLGDYISILTIRVINGGPTVGVDLPVVLVK